MQAAKKKLWKGSKNPRRPLAKFSDLSEYLLKMKEKLGRFPKSEELPPAVVSTIQVYHGGLTNVKAMLNEPIKYKFSSFSLKNWPVLKKDLDEVMKQLGHFPSSDDLRIMHRNDLRGAIEKHHGGFPKVREKTGCSQVTLRGSRSLSIWENYKTEMLKVAEILGHFPAIKELRKIGRHDLGAAAHEHHDGFVAARSRLGIEPILKTGKNSLKHFENIKRELLEFKKTLGYFPSATDIQAARQDISGAAHTYHGGYKNLARRIGRPSSAKEGKEFKLDENLREIIEKGLAGKPKDVARLREYYAAWMKNYINGTSIAPKYKHDLYLRGMEILESVRKGAGGPEQFAVGFWRSLKTGLSNEYIRLKTGYNICTSDLIKLRFIHRHMAKFRERHNRPATLDELRAATNYNAYDLMRLLNMHEPVSMDKPLYESETLTLGDTIAAQEKPGSNKENLGSSILAGIEGSNLERMDKDLLVGRFGLGGKKPKLLGELAAKHGMTRPGMKQRINDALLRLRESG